MTREIVSISRFFGTQRYRRGTMIDREKFCRFYADIDPEIGGGYKWSVRSNGFPV